jgi:hypothetical protein
MEFLLIKNIAGDIRLEKCNENSCFQPNCLKTLPPTSLYFGYDYGYNSCYYFVQCFLCDWYYLCYYITCWGGGTDKTDFKDCLLKWKKCSSGVNNIKHTLLNYTFLYKAVKS